MPKEKEPVIEFLCWEHIHEAPVVMDIDDDTHVYWARREHDASREICEFGNCTESADWVCFSRTELEATDDARYVPVDDTHERLVEILALLRAQQAGANVKLQLKSSTTKGGLEGYELTTTEHATEAQLMAAYDAAILGRDLILAKLLAPLDPNADA